MMPEKTNTKSFQRYDFGSPGTYMPQADLAFELNYSTTMYSQFEFLCREVYVKFKKMKSLIKYTPYRTVGSEENSSPNWV